MSRELFDDHIANQIQLDRERKAMYPDQFGEFKDREPSAHLIGDLVHAILAIDNEADARDFFAGYVDYINEQPDRHQPAEHVARSNVGWCFGEGMSGERRAMWARVCDASHPVFGKTIPSPEAAVEAGMKWAGGSCA